MLRGLGGWQGLLGLLLIGLALGLAYGSLFGNVLATWIPMAGTPAGILLLGAVAALAILTWLAGAAFR